MLKKHFEDAPRNATYRSKRTQNELIPCCADEVKEAKYFFLLGR